MKFKFATSYVCDAFCRAKEKIMKLCVCVFCANKEKSIPFPQYYLIISFEVGSKMYHWFYTLYSSVIFQVLQLANNSYALHTTLSNVYFKACMFLIFVILSPLSYFEHNMGCISLHLFLCFFVSYDAHVMSMKTVTSRLKTRLDQASLVVLFVYNQECKLKDSISINVNSRCKKF